MRCNNFKYYIERYSDNALPTQKQAAWEDHLKTCFKCRCAYADFNTIKSFIMEDSIPPAPGNLTADIMRCVRNSIVGVKNRNERILIPWWKEAAIPVRLAFSVAFFIIATVGVFAGKDLWSAPDSKVTSQYTELDTFFESQNGSLEDVYLQLIHTPIQGGER